jgi:hypothetical protein
VVPGELVSFRIVSKALFAVGFSGDDGVDPMFHKPGAKRIGVIPFSATRPAMPGVSLTHVATTVQSATAGTAPSTTARILLVRRLW